MSAPGGGGTTADDVLALVDAVVYGDAFDCAVTFDELWRYCLLPIDWEELEHRLADPVVRAIVAERDGLYVLRGREELVPRRLERRARADLLRRRGRRVARCLQHFPFVRGILLTGSVAADDAHDDADVDMLVIVQSRRLALAFALLAPLSRFLTRNVFCPNYYLSETHLTLERRDHYVARELMQSESLAGNAGRLFAANHWTTALLPNATPRDEPASPLPFGRALQWLLELPFRGAFGDRLDRRAHRLALARLAAHHAGTGGVPSADVTRGFAADVELRFHGSATVAHAGARYAARRAEVRRRLEAALAGAEP